jgi:tryptophan halogenase
MIKKIKNIVIFGGGTSGWLTAAYMSNQLNFPCNITLIESKAIGPIGVGEGTQPFTSRFLHDAGLEPKQWMKPSHAAFKYGVLLSGWNKEPYFVDNDFIENHIMAPGLYAHDYFIDKPNKEFTEWLPAYRLAMANKSPKLAGYDHAMSLQSFKDWGAVHFSAADILDTIHDLIKDRITYFDTKITEVKTSDEGIEYLLDEQGRKHTADLFLDCTGFEAKLINKELQVPFIDISSILPCDSAVAMPTQFKDPVNECHPYTKATTMTSGWRWTIPTFKQIGNGYVYSSKHLTPEQAEQELRDSIGEYDAKARHLKMRCGASEKVAHKNVIAVGLSAGFVEPLEATGITFTTKIVEALCGGLNHHNGIWNENLEGAFNAAYINMVVEIIAFVWAHYHYSDRDDTPFWQEIRNQKIEDAPSYVQEIFSQFYPKLHRNFYLDDKTSGFHTGHWFSMLHANGAYDDKEKMQLTAEQLKYAEYYVKTKKTEIDNAIEYFPNHYEFLKEWYESTGDSLPS